MPFHGFSAAFGLKCSAALGEDVERPHEATSRWRGGGGRRGCEDREAGLLVEEGLWDTVDMDFEACD